MAALPPRHKNTTFRPSKQHQTELQILLQMGVSKARAEKALASTGHRGVQLASDWLLAHVNDPFLDDENPREYILYVCPTGSLLNELEKFWLESKKSCGWNGAHNFIPHITLVSFFKAPDESALQLSKTLKQVVENIGPMLNKPLCLERYVSQNFMGFFVTEDDANYLKRIALQFVKEVSHSTISLEPHVKSLHLTLAYQFPTNHFNALKYLVDTLDTSCPANWELRLYSRDARLSTRQVHKVLYAHASRDPDELELRIGDYIYINPDAMQTTTDGWVEGVSWLTGVSGYLPQNYVERTAESEAWTMHCALKLNQSNFRDKADGENEIDDVDGASMLETISINDQSSIENVDIKETTSRSPTEDEACKSSSSGVEHNIPKSVTNLVENQASALNSASIFNSSLSSENKCHSDLRRIYIMRHGERIDFTFGNYLPQCFDEAGNYTQKDMNMPEVFPIKKNGVNAWKKDSPLTNIGLYQANLVGLGLKKNGEKPYTVFCSPSYRCVQTCDSVLDALGIRKHVQICIEPGLFEWLAWYQEGLPDFYMPEELKELGFNINIEYEPLTNFEKLKSCIEENLQELYKRNSDVVDYAIKSNYLGNVLLVGHAITLDTCTRSVLGKELRQPNEISRLMLKVPYCSLVSLEKLKGEDEWSLVEPPICQVTHNNNQRFDWHTLSA